MAKKQTKKSSEVDLDNADGNVDKIREILFGGQMRDYEQRFADLEDRLTRNIDVMSRNMEKRVDRLDAYAKRELEKLSGQFKEERQARRKDGKSSARELKDLSSQFESWCTELEEGLGEESQALRRSLQEQSEELSGMISDVHNEMSKSLSGETRNLANAKLARDDMAELLAEMALRLKKDVKLPDA